MKKHDDVERAWALLRFSVVGELLASPPARGELQLALKRLSQKFWTSPTGEKCRFGVSTIERWYYQALRSQEPTEALRRRRRQDAGRELVMSTALLKELEMLYRAYPSWSYKLHADNLVALVEQKPELGPAASYTTVRRRMKKRGWLKKRLARTDGQRRAQHRLETREVRSFEKAHPHALWHFDYHQAHRRVVTPDGRWLKPWCLCILDDFSRLCCHIQWYLEESAQTLAHGLEQAFLKRGIPRAFLCDNGGAMIAEETKSAADALSILHETTLPHSPYQNGKQETFWATLEGRLMAMLSAVDPLRLEFLNHSTQAWVEQEYNRTRHDELGVSPLDRYLQGQDVGRPSPELTHLHFLFTRIVTRRQRHGDGTVSIAGIRFEVPGSMRHLERLTLRYAAWDLSQVYLVDPRHTTQKLATIYPQDKRRNANQQRRTVQPTETTTPVKPADSVPPLLRKLMQDYAATGLPPAYLPHLPACEEEPHA